MTANTYIVAANRTSVVPHGGAFRDLDFDVLATPPIRQCLVDAGFVPSDVNELILSNALGAGGNPARITALRAGLPESLAGLSIDRQCVGGLDAILLAKALVQSVQAEIVLAGGSESYSLRPSRAFKSDWRSDLVVRDQARFTPWPDRDPDMATAANDLAELCDITAEQQNDWAMRSHEKAMAAKERLSREIVNPENIHIEPDPFARFLTPALCRKAPSICGSVTAANTCVAADGAAMLAVVSEEVLTRIKPAFALRITGGVTVGGDPTLPGRAPVQAIQTVLNQAGKTVDNIAVIELMEAYAAQAITCVNGADLPIDKINRGGGALARGHPIGASGAVLIVRCFHELQYTRGLGLAAIAGAGGLGSAILFESIFR